MFDGIYCKEKNSYDVYESILIDEFNKCINSAAGLLSCAPNSKMNHTISASSKEVASEDPGRWKTEMNVRAVYSVDGETYEAVIEKILDPESAIIRFHGYNNKEIISLETLQPSRGEKAIKEQIQQSQIERTSDDEEESGESDDGLFNEIDWKVGMACRALYDINETIYEATIIEVNENERTAVLEMTGFGVQFKAGFENIYESIAEYRGKQMSAAHKYHLLKQVNCSNSVVSPPGNKVESKRETSNQKSLETGVNSIGVQGQLNQPVMNSTISKLVSAPSESHLPVSFTAEEIWQPESESEALACLISANYLSGYYAGYYDCIRRQHSSPKK